MDRGLYLAISSMRSAERRIDFTAHNLANLNTAGFKRTEATHRSFLVNHPAGQNQTVGVRGRQDFSQGNLQVTGHPYHLALRGQGFFAVESPSGELYTRDGSFGITADGEWVNDVGWPVAWETRLGPIDPSRGDPVVDASGEVTQGNQRLGRLKLVDFEDYGRLEELDRGLWRPRPGARETVADAEVQQGNLETSNASAIDEMVQLIANQRAYEISSRVVETMDQSYQRLYRPN